MRLLIVGCGYVGSEVARIAPPNWRVLALTRSQERATELQHLPCEPIVASWHDEQSLSTTPPVDYILVAIPHRVDCGLDEQTHLVGLQNLLKHLPTGWRKLVYLSTTGVYGANEDTVDEETGVSPARIGPQIAVEAERMLAAQLPSNRFVILRLAGIYGPGRIPLAAKLRAGLPLAVPRNGYLNLVHVADIARMIYLLFEIDLQRTCYVFSDGQPVLRAEFYDYLAQLCGVEQPIFEQPGPANSRAQRATSKQVSPTRIIAETNFEYEFPNYRLGLVDAIRSQ